MTIPTNYRALFQIPPEEYDPEYFRQLLKELENFITSVNNGGDIQATSIPCDEDADVDHRTAFRDAMERYRHG